MPFDRDVTIDFNADISGYSASMGQMIQQTSQYTAAADGMIGKIGKLNDVVMSGVKSMSAFTQTNKVATAQAAAYQQQLSKIETSAKVTGKSFSDLEKTTKGLAKDFPIGMKQAVEQVESLQEAGVTTNKEISSLAKTFTKLGAATGTFGPELGKNMLQLNRTFQNGTNSMEKYADSLTTVTHLYGANAGAVTSFAKSIAPVAATVGMSETSVIGLSTAFSRLGEDGYAAANTFNKVMLDMSKSIREGTPEAKIYAEVMGTTADSLKQTWESNPAEGFIDFVEAIKKQGIGGIRSLEQLGLEGVRTQKTIMSLANSGNMREIVEKAQSSYGSGMTGTAAETAMGGVNDQLTMLNETMAQTASTAGKPFLGFLEKVLQVANYISRTISDIVESDFIQKLAKIVGVGGGVFAATKLLNSTAGTLAMLEWGGKKIARANVFQEFREGRGEGLAADTAGRGIGYRAGAALGMYAGPGSGEPFRQALGRNVRNWANMGGNALALWNRANTSMVLQAMDREGVSTPAGERFKAASSQLQDLNTKGMGWGERRALIKKINSELADATKEMMQGEGGIANAARSYAARTATSASYMARVGGMGARGLGQVGGALTMGLATGTSAAVLGGAALVGGAGYMLYKSRKGEEEARERGGQDAYRMYNEFAEKAGLATKGLVSFAQALSESTSKIAAESQTREESYKITEKEIIQSKSAGYERAYSTRGKAFMDNLLPGGPSAEKEAIRLRGMLGSNPTPEAINRIQMDLANQFGKEFAEKVTKTLREIYEGGEGGKPMTSKQVQDMLHEASVNSRFLGLFGTKESKEFAEMEEAERARAQNVERSVKGVALQQVEGYTAAEITAEKLNAAAAAKKPGQVGGPASGGLYSVKVETDPEVLQIQKDNLAAIDALVEENHLNSEEEKKVRAAYAAAARPQTVTYGGQIVPKAKPLTAAGLLEIAGRPEEAEIYREKTAAGGVAKGGFRNLTGAQKEAMAISPMEEAAAAAVKRTTELGGVAGTLATDMAGAAKAYRDWTKTADNADKTFEDWVTAGSEGATDLQKAYAEVKNMPGDAAKQAKLSSEIVKTAVANATRAGTGVAGVQQEITTAMTTSTGEELPALQAARAKAVMDMRLTQGVSTMELQAGTIKTGKIAEQGLLRSDITAETRAQYEADEAAGKQAQLERQQQIRTFQLQMGRQQEDFNTSRLRMNRNYELQMNYQAEDFAKQRKYMIQDYHTSVREAEEDFYTQRHRAQRDFDKQVKRQAEQTAKNMFDPYQRIGAEMVTDMAILEQSLIEQNKSISDQLSSVGKLSQMGLSKDAIDQLKLMDPTKNQQVQRLLADAQSDPGSIQKINELISKRMKLGYKLNTSEFNKDFKNMKDDFGQSMEDMGDDFDKNMDRGEKRFKQGLKRNGEAFATAQGRAAAQHQQALMDMDADNKKAITRAQEDLTGMAKEFTSTYTDVQKGFLQDLADLPSNLSQKTKDSITKVLNDEIDAIKDANKKATDAASAAAAMAGTGIGGAGSDAGSGWGEDISDVDGPTAGKGTYSGRWQRYSSGKWHGGADISAPLGTPTYSVINGKVKYVRRMATSYGIHAVLTDGKHDFLYGHMSGLTVNAGDKVRPGTQVGKVGSTGNSTGNHLHFEVRRFGMGNGEAGNVNPAPWLASGGVVLNHMRPHVGESGPEAVVPLNDKGMKFLSDAMTKAARYWQPTAASGTRAQGYNTPITNNIYSYDQRTQFMGEVHVESQDPEAMARKLAQRERRNRLARKTGSAA